jgi:hypothetical protein
MTRYRLTLDATQDEHCVYDRDADGDDVVALPCPWHADALRSCLCDLTYGTFWCMECDRTGTCCALWIWPPAAPGQQG